MSAKPPIKYYGGKQKLARRITDLLPLHHTYIEMFGGSGAILFQKQQSPVEVYNDIDDDIVNFFTVLRNERQARRLRRHLHLTPYARREHELASVRPPDGDPVERARRLYVQIRQSYNGVPGKSWSYWRNGNAINPFYNSLELIASATRRLRNVYIENCDWPSILKIWDGPRTLIYADPPYISESRSTPRVYRHEMTVVEHEQLLQRLSSCEAMVVISGYSHPLYETILHDWTRLDLDVACWSSMSKKNIARGNLKDRRTESLWIKPNSVNDQNREAIEHAQAQRED
jgi:DNA adenine methylase